MVDSEKDTTRDNTIHNLAFSLNTLFDIEQTMTQPMLHRRLQIFLVATLALFLTTPRTCLAEEKNFEILFNGKNLEGWKGNNEFWSVKNGAIFGQTTKELPTKQNTFLIWQGGEVGDFEFRCKVRFSGNNSGVQYRSSILNKEIFALSGYQADLHQKQDFFGMMYGEKSGRGIIAKRGERLVYNKDGKKEIKGKIDKSTHLVDDEWNDLRIVAVGNRMIHQVNGQTTIDLTDNHPQAALKGYLGLQLHAGPPMKVEFRNILLRKLTGEDAKATLEKAIKSNTPKKKTNASAKATSKPDSKWLTSKPKAHWIWAEKPEKDQKVWFRHSFKINKPIQSVHLYSTCDNRMTLWLNGKKVAESQAWEAPIEMDVSKQIKSGINLIAIEGQNAGGIAALMFKMVVTSKDGSTQTIVSNKDWKLNEQKLAKWNTKQFDDSKWIAAKQMSVLGSKPWNIPKYTSAKNSDGGSVPTDPLASKNIMSPPGFLVERIYSIPKSQGSWVSMTTDPQGRLYACDQRDAGLYRITIREDETPLVEKVTINKLADLSGAQGLLWAFDSLWFHKNGGNIYRLRDTDSDDKLDSYEIVPSMTGGGEHGNHALILSEDKKSIYVVGGNHAPLMDHDRSRVTTWDEDLLLPRMWDARGHARGRMAPGGWVTELDPETYKQTVYSTGYRNQYDVALNRHGDMFTYDADMEWDMGMPWYRPTRICHVTSGSEYGWRSGSGKWPTYYEDSLPPVVEIGPGSPTGVVSGLGTKFPTRYQDAIFALDWTFGTIYAIHLMPDGAGYRGEAEPFVYGSPLPVTDATIGHDGTMYFAVGGRGMDSALFRVRYVGNESINPPSKRDSKNALAVAQRRKLESFHGRVDKAAVETAWPLLSSSDRFLRYAARIAIESQPVETWADRVLKENNSQAKIVGAIALARRGDESYREKLLSSLKSIIISTLDDSQTLGLLRAYSLTFIRLGKPTETERDEIVNRLEPFLPSSNDDINTELIRLLVYLRSKSVIPKAIDLIVNRASPKLPNWSELASRNSRYGATVKGMLENHPPTQELNYAFMLRNLRKGWTLEQRREYFKFLNEASKKSGGASYAGFLTRIRDAALGNCSDTERKALEDITGENFNPVPDFTISEPKGPGKKWTMEFALSAVRGPADFENGRSLFFSAKCASCHRLRGLGGNIGPDLTSIRNKFDKTYVLDATINPSKHISDQYGSSVVILDTGKSVTGLVIEGENGMVKIYTNEPNAKPIEVSKESILNMEASKVSQMPKDLLNKLNAEEINDLIVYLMSAGDPKDKLYNRKKKKK